MNTGSQEWEGLLLQMARDDMLNGVVVLNNIWLANALKVAGVDWVVAREYDLEWVPDLEGNAGDIQRGRDRWNAIKGRFFETGLRRDIYIQIMNEKNIPDDAFYEMGWSHAAYEDGYRAALFGDSHGCPAGDNFERVWKLRVSSGCMAQAAREGHIYLYHAYGSLDETQKATDKPGCGIYFDANNQEIARDDKLWTYYSGGRVKLAYESFVPVDQRIPCVAGEAGPSDAVFRGVQQMLHEAIGFQKRLEEEPYIKTACLWALGWQEPWYGSNFGPDLAEIYRRYQAWFNAR